MKTYSDEVRTTYCHNIGIVHQEYQQTAAFDMELECHPETRYTTPTLALQLLLVSARIWP